MTTSSPPASTTRVLKIREIDAKRGPFLAVFFAPGMRIGMHSEGDPGSGEHAGGRGAAARPPFGHQ